MMGLFQNIVRRLWKKQKGAGGVEYGLIVGLIAVASIVAISHVGGNIRSLFLAVSNTLSNGVEAAPTVTPAAVIALKGSVPSFDLTNTSTLNSGTGEVYQDGAIVFENTGNATSSTLTTVFTLVSQNHFMVTNDGCTGQMLAPAATCSVTVRSFATANGTLGSATVSVGGASTTVSGTASGLAGEITLFNVSGASFTGASVTGLSITDANSTVNTTSQKTEGAVQTLTFKNTGRATMATALGAATVTGTNASFFVKGTDNCQGKTLAYGQTCTVTIIPTTTANVTTQTATLSLPNGLDVSLAGDATGLPATIAFTSSSTAALGAVVDGTGVGACVDLPIQNTGKVALSGLSVVSFTGGNTANFQACTASTTACGTTLAIGATCNVGARVKGWTTASFTSTASLSATEASTSATRGVSGSASNKSCKAILANATAVGQTVSSGTYDINTGSSAYTVYCDMTTSGGGWTLTAWNRGPSTTTSASVTGTFFVSVVNASIIGTPTANSAASLNTEAFSAAISSTDAMLVSTAYSASPLIDTGFGLWTYNATKCTGNLRHTSRTAGCSGVGANDDYTTWDMFNIAVNSGLEGIVPYYLRNYPAELCYNGKGNCDFSFYLR